MSNFQKIIKYFAIAFAALIIFNIVSGIIVGVDVLDSVFSNDKEISNNKLNEFKVNDDFSILDIELVSVNLLIKSGDTLKVESDGEDIKINEINNKLIITENQTGWFGKKSNSDLVIYVPNDYVFNEVSIESGAGRVDIEYINTKELELDLGAGKVEVYDLNVSNEASINGGAGDVTIEKGNINNLELDMGIGRVELNSILTGSSEIDAGIGEMELKLLGGSDNYRINVSKGIGTVIVDGNKMSDSSNYGSGRNIVNVNGGIGNINVDFE